MPPAVIDPLLGGYAPAPKRFDELLEAAGRVRAPWRHFIDELSASTPAQVHARMALVEREIRDHGITYNVYADPQGTDRPWVIDPIPLILSSRDWEQIEAGV